MYSETPAFVVVSVAACGSAITVLNGIIVENIIINADTRVIIFFLFILIKNTSLLHALEEHG